MSKPFRDRRCSSSLGTFETLEPRQLLNGLVVDVRQEGTTFGSGKNLTVVEGGTVTLGIYLRNIDQASDVSADALHGLGGFNASLQTFGEKTNSGSKAWPVSPTAADTVLNATASSNKLSTTPFDFGFSNGTITDLTFTGTDLDPDSDTDMRSMSAFQLDGGNAYQTNIGVGGEVLLGTVTYQALTLSGSARPLARTVAVNTFYTNATGGQGGLLIKGLINSATDDTNQVSSGNLVTSASQIGTPVVVTVVSSALNSISGRVFNDKNANGIFDGNDDGISGFRVFLDKDFDGVLDSDETSKPVSATGTYTFSNVPSGTYRVREVFRSGWRQTFPALGYYELNLTGGQTAKSLSFANTDTVLIKGRVFMDANKNGKLDSAEPGLGGWTLFIDKDNDGILDSNELTATSDVNGNYRFFNMPAGTFIVRAVAQSKYKQTTPSGGAHTITLAAAGTVSNKNFGEKRL